jgi:hypothetical protein
VFHAGGDDERTIAEWHPLAENTATATSKEERMAREGSSAQVERQAATVDELPQCSSRSSFQSNREVLSSNQGQS